MPGEVETGGESCEAPQTTKGGDGTLHAEATKENREVQPGGTTAEDSVTMRELLAAAHGDIHRLLGSEAKDDVLMDEETADADNPESNWRACVPLLYDNIMCHTLEWPAITVQPLPLDYYRAEPNLLDDEPHQLLLLGTHADTENKPSILLLKIATPSDDAILRVYTERSDYSGYGFGKGAADKFTVLKDIPVDADVNRIRALPQKLNIVASLQSGGSVLVTDIAESPEPQPSPHIAHYSDLATTDGYSLAWNTTTPGALLAGWDDGIIALFDVQGTHHGATGPTRKFKAAVGVNDVVWLQDDPHGFICASECGRLNRYDVRSPDHTPCAQVICSPSGLHTVVCHYAAVSTVLTGGVTGEIFAVDLRHFDKPRHEIKFHKEPILRLDIAPWAPWYLASACEDSTVCLWDLQRAGMEQAPQDSADGPPELLMTHCGHQAAVWDVKFTASKDDPLTLVTTSHDNALQLWKPKDTVLNPDEDAKSNTDPDTLES